MTADVSYVLPLLRHRGDDGLEELTAYLRWLSSRVELIVADGSAPDVFAEHRRTWDFPLVHLPVTTPAGTYGKVTGVHVGIEAATHEAVIVADDDVRYTDATLAGMADALRSADLVRPQNYFDPLPWHAAWDTARTLLNRLLGADSPGTLGVRRSFFMGMGGYAADVMYENLELIRTVAAHGGRVADRPDLCVRRLPGTVRRFLEQRPRQAYDDFAQPAKLAAFLAVMPLIGLGRRSRKWLGVAAVASVGMAEVGRRRHGGQAYFPAHTSWFAPLWLLERSLCVWLAVAYRLTGGVPYSGERFRTAAHSVRELRRRASCEAFLGAPPKRASQIPSLLG